MLNWARQLLKKKPEAQIASALYDGIVSQARQPVFYRDLGVADDVDGRFDMIAVHFFLVLDRLKDDAAIRPVTQELANLVMTDMDSSLREMGVSDISVGKKVQKMARALYGRIEAYQAAYAEDDVEMLTAAVLRNVYRRNDGDRGGAEAIARYMRLQSQGLENCPVSEFAAGKIGFVQEGAIQ